jgi:hypothetical protein
MIVCIEALRPLENDVWCPGDSKESNASGSEECKWKSGCTGTGGRTVVSIDRWC